LVNCSLWVNESGDLVSNYECFIGNDRFNFSLPAGDGLSIELSVLRAGSQPIEDYPQSIIDYIDERVTGGGSAYQTDYFDGDSSITTYSLSGLTATPELSKVFFNGIKQEYSVDYSLSGSDLTIIRSPIYKYSIEIQYYTSAVGSLRYQKFNASANQSIFILDFASSDSNAEAYINGIRQIRNSYTVQSGTLTLLAPLNDLFIVEIYY
jgi:hypothetical protein